MNSATVSTIFFSLRGTLSRPQWRLAMLAALSVWVFGLSVFGHGEGEVFAPITDEIRPSWPLLCWSLAFVSIGTLLCAKRLLDCRRPVWLALTIPPPGVALSLAIACNMHTSLSLLTVAAGYLAVFAAPAFLACALYDADD